MQQDDEQPADNTETGGFATGEFGTDEFSRTLAPDEMSMRRRRRRSRSRKRKKKNAAPMLTILGIGMFCLILVSIGVLVGLSYSDEQTDAKRYQQALQAREASHNEWMAECAGLGYSDWACNKFDRVHFEKAKKLDLFRCTKTADANLHQCQYRLGTAEVLVSLPESFEPGGQFTGVRERAYAVVRHSDIDDRHYVVVSAKGRLELRSRDEAAPLFIINPSTGSLNALHEDVRPDQ